MQVRLLRRCPHQEKRGDGRWCPDQDGGWGPSTLGVLYVLVASEAENGFYYIHNMKMISYRRNFPPKISRLDIPYTASLRHTCFPFIGADPSYKSPTGVMPDMSFPRSESDLIFIIPWSHIS